MGFLEVLKGYLNIAALVWMSIQVRDRSKMTTAVLGGRLQGMRGELSCEYMCLGGNCMESRIEGNWAVGMSMEPCWTGLTPP